jgi:hypothetical protein
MLCASIVVEMTKALTSGCSRLPMLYQMPGIGNANKATHGVINKVILMDSPQGTEFDSVHVMRI